MNLKLTLCVCIFIIFSFHAHAHSTEASKFLLGKLSQEKFYNENGKEIKYDIVELNKPKDIYIQSENLNFNKVKKIQLNFLDKKINLKYKINSKVFCKDIYSADSMYHYTDVICIVDKIQYQ